MLMMQDFPETPKQKKWECKRMPDKIDWDGLMDEVLKWGKDVPALSFWKAGEDEAYAVCSSCAAFCGLGGLNVSSHAALLLFAGYPANAAGYHIMSV